LSFTTRGSRRKRLLSRLWFRLMFCWGSLPVVPPLQRRLQRLAATNCLKFFNGLDAHTVEVDDADSLHLNSEYGLL